MGPKPDRSLEVLNTPEGYRRYFMDAGLWHLFVERACKQNGLKEESLRPGRAGTFPAFIVNERWVVKFFGDRFGGKDCWEVEKEAAELMKGLPEIPAAALIAAGTLEAREAWHYLIFKFVPGVSFGEVYERVAPKERIALAGWLGDAVRQMHQIEVPHRALLPSLSEEMMRTWFARRWPQDRRKWPAPLANQVEKYLEVNRDCLQSNTDCFIHADLTGDHLLGRLDGGHWQTRAVIDFGDAILGNLYYELAALHLDLFRCEKPLLRAFLDAYDLFPDPDFVPKAMVTSLLQQFDVYTPLFEWKPELCQARTLNELAERLWQPDSLFS